MSRILHDALSEGVCLYVCPMTQALNGAFIAIDLCIDKYYNPMREA